MLWAKVDDWDSLSLAEQQTIVADLRAQERGPQQQKKKKGADRGKTADKQDQRQSW